MFFDFFKKRKESDIKKGQIGLLKISGLCDKMAKNNFLGVQIWKVKYNFIRETYI